MTQGEINGIWLFRIVQEQRSKVKAKMNNSHFSLLSRKENANFLLNLDPFFVLIEFETSLFDYHLQFEPVAHESSY